MCASVHGGCGKSPGFGGGAGLGFAHGIDVTAGMLAIVQSMLLRQSR
jgi:hypothetical protein